MIFIQKHLEVYDSTKEMNQPFTVLTILLISLLMIIIIIKIIIMMMMMMMMMMIIVKFRPNSKKKITEKTC